jgi:hypothetical protein
MVDPGFPRNVSLPSQGLTTKIVEEFKGLLGGIFLKMPFDYNFNRHDNLPFRLNLNFQQPEYNHFIEIFYQEKLENCAIPEK